MKRILLLLGLTLITLSCNKDDEAVIVPEDILPPATQTGAVMLACKVNGEPYICKGYNQVTSYYQWVDGGYGFIVGGKKETDFVWNINLGNLGNAPISEGTYTLNGNNPGYFFGGGYWDYLESMLKA